MSREAPLLLNATETLTLGLAVQELHAAFGPGQTYLFGSCARGTPHLRSDMDVLHVPRSRTAPSIGSNAALDHVEKTVERRGGTIPLGIQIVPDHMFEDAAFEEPYLKTAINDIRDAKQLVVESLKHLPDAALLRAALQQNRPKLKPAPTRTRDAERD